MRFEIEHQTKVGLDSRSQQVAQRLGLDETVEFRSTFDLPMEERDWSIGVVVGPSGSGKTSLGEKLWGGGHIWQPGEWPTNQPIIDAILPGDKFDSVTAALASVGLGAVPSWLRPYHVLSNGEQFRAGLAKVMAEAPNRVVIDEFSSVVDRQIACVGAFAFSKSWRREARRTGAQVVLLTPHYDVLEWMDPDWVLDTGTGELHRTRGQYQRPEIKLDIRQTKWKYWKYFKPHHYLIGAGPMAFSTAFVGFINDEPVAHMGMTGHHIGHGRREARGCRMVVMPEWQGAGISLQFMNYLCERELQGIGFIGSPVTTQFHTAHPALCKVLRRDDRWRQISQAMHGVNGKPLPALNGQHFGGHFRVIIGFRYFGQRGVDQANEARAAKAALDASVREGDGMRTYA